MVTLMTDQEEIVLLDYLREVKKINLRNIDLTKDRNGFSAGYWIGRVDFLTTLISLLERSEKILAPNVIKENPTPQELEDTHIAYL